MPACRVRVVVEAVGAVLDPDDAGVEGVYGVDLAASVAVDDRADRALDCFHDHIGIACLDGFEIYVLDATGERLPDHGRVGVSGDASFVGSCQ